MSGGVWRDEFGVMEDRTGNGLGVLLAVIRWERRGAEVAAEAWRLRTDNPVYIQRRRVWLGDWEPDRTEGGV